MYFSLSVFNRMPEFMFYSFFGLDCLLGSPRITGRQPLCTRNVSLPCPVQAQAGGGTLQAMYKYGWGKRPDIGTQIVGH